MRDRQQNMVEEEEEAQPLLEVVASEEGFQFLGLVLAEGEAASPQAMPSQLAQQEAALVDTLHREEEERWGPRMPESAGMALMDMM